MVNIESRPKAIVYVDGFNLYNRLLINSKFKWLNLASLLDTLLPTYKVTKINYFSANIKSQPHDLSQPIRQQIYFRALKTNPRIEIVLGKFISDKKKFPIYPWKYDEQGKPVKTKVFFANEKGSDVNLASNLVFDVLNNKADAYFVVTNDSDQAGPLKLLKENTGAILGLIYPSADPTVELNELSLPETRRIRKRNLQAHQFPEVMIDEIGEFRKPNNW